MAPIIDFDALWYKRFFVWPKEMEYLMLKQKGSKKTVMIGDIS